MIEYRPWMIRGYTELPVYMIWVENPITLSEIRTANRNLIQQGLYIIQKKQGKIRLKGWKEFEDGAYYKIIQ